MANYLPTTKQRRIERLLNERYGLRHIARLVGADRATIRRYKCEGFDQPSFKKRSICISSARETESELREGLTARELDQRFVSANRF